MLITVSFFWKNDQPDGLGFTFGPPDFTPAQLEAMFTGDVVKQYMRDSDDALGTSLVQDYLDQLAAISQQGRSGAEPTLQQAILAALNIMWLSERGFIPNDEFNGCLFIRSED